MILGIDPSSYLEMQEKHPHFFFKGKEIDPLSLLHVHNGCRLLRIRLWVDPHDGKGRPYRGGTNDWDHFLALAKQGMEKGYAIMLDFHYSDFWCDPSKQTLPKSWQGFSIKDVVDRLYSYTKKTLQKCVENHLRIACVQIGNEITNGMLWPLGRLDDNPKGGRRIGFDQLCQFLATGAKACREVLPEAQILLHLERSGAKELHQEFFDEMALHHMDYDVIALSYYPYWHGPFNQLFANVENLKKRYSKPIMIVETGYGFTTTNCDGGGNQGPNFLNDEFIRKSPSPLYLPFPLSPEGQKTFVEELLRRSQEHGVAAVIYWEPLWLPLPGLEWASKEGEAYIHETQKTTGNEWANQCLFDYQGNATPALEAFQVPEI